MRRFRRRLVERGRDEGRALWLARATPPTAAGAYLANLTDKVWRDAEREAGDWLDSRQAH